MASCRKWILNIHSFTIWIKNEQLPVDHTFWWPILRKKFHEIFTLVWEAISKTRASGFIRRSKHLGTIKALGRSGLVLSSVSRCLQPPMKHSHSFLKYYIKHPGHLRTLDKCGKHSPQARVFYISLVFSNDHRVLSQCNTRLRLLYLLKIVF